MRGVFGFFLLNCCVFLFLFFGVKVGGGIPQYIGQKSFRRIGGDDFAISIDSSFFRSVCSLGMGVKKMYFPIR